MAIQGTEGLSDEQIHAEVQQGGRFVLYTYCISIVFMTFKRPSSLQFLRAGDGGVKQGLGYSALTFLLGWWGIPWGPIYSIQCLWSNFRGGRDVTAEVLAHAAASTVVAAPASRIG